MTIQHLLNSSSISMGFPHWENPLYTIFGSLKSPEKAKEDFPYEDWLGNYFFLKNNLIFIDFDAIFIQ